MVKERIRVQCSCNYGEVTIYCRDHKNVICVQCNTMKHRNCQIMTIEEACGSMKTSTIESTHSRMNRLREKLEILEKARREDAESLNTQAAECRDVVNSFMKELIQNIEEMAKQALDDIRKCDDRQMGTIQQHIDTCNTAMNMLNIDCRLFDNARTSSDKRLIFIRNLQLSATMDEVVRVLKDVEKEVKEPNIYFECYKNLKQTDTKSLGVVRSTLGHNEKELFLSNTNLISLENVDIKSSSDASTPCICGSVFLPSGELVLCDRNNSSIKVFNPNFALKEMIQVRSVPWEVSMLSQEEVVISLPNNHMLQFINVLPKLKLGSSIDLGQVCYGVSVKDGMIYVSFQNKEIRVYDRTGQQQKNMFSSIHFNSSFYISVAQTGILAMSEFFKNTVRVYINEGETYSYKNPKLDGPKGLYVDDEEIILVCGCESNNVHMIDKNGKLIRILLSYSNSLYRPQTVSFRPSDRTLVVGGQSQTLVVCKLG